MTADKPVAYTGNIKTEVRPMEFPEIVNVTPHAITFAACECREACEHPQVTVQPSGTVISARVTETVAGSGPSGVALVRTTFSATDEAAMQLAALHDAHPGAVVVGSIIAAQAFPGRVFAMTPAPGFERVAPELKRMNPHKFTTF